MASPPAQPIRKVGLITCVFLVAATMVGNGIYTSLGIQLLSISSSFTLLLLWALGGLVALCGALSYAELSAQMPHSGGEYYYFTKIYHPAIGTAAGIITQIAGCVGPIALASMAFGTYFQAMFPFVPPMVSSIVLVTLVTGIHLIDLGVSASFQDITTGLKFLLVAFICYLGMRYASVPLKTLLPTKFALQELFQPTSGVTLLFCYYSYSGWNASTYIADDVTTSQRTVGRSLIIGSLFVMIVYLLVNAIFLISAPKNELRGVLDIGRVVATHLIGQQGGCVMSALIAFGLIASISAMTWTGPRIMQAMGKHLLVLRWFSCASANNIPLRATLFQYILVIVLLLTSSFKTILVSTQFALILCELLGVLSVIVLRRRAFSRASHHKNKSYLQLDRIFRADPAAACNNVMDTALGSNFPSSNIKDTIVVEDHRSPFLDQHSQRLTTDHYEISGLTQKNIKIEGQEHEELNNVISQNTPHTRETIFRSPLYPLPQLFFVAVSMMALLYTLWTNSFEAFLGIVLILSALASYPFLSQKQKPIVQ
jgi:APA family basic amino acid/polyamine antiporter